MSGRQVRFTTLLAWAIWSLAALLTLAAVPLGLANGGQWDMFLALAFGVTFSTAGAVIASRHPTNPMGWLFIAMSLLWALANVARGYAIYGLVTRPGSLPGAVFMAWLEQWPLWFVFPSGIALILLLFPTGRPPSPRWWPVAWLTIGCALSMVIGSMFGPWRLSDALREPAGPVIHFGVENPLGIGPLKGLLRVMDIVGRMGSFLLAPVAAAGLVVRFVHSDGERRQQLKWVLYVGTLIILGIVGGLTLLSPFPTLQNASFNVLVVGGLFVGLPGAAAIAILKYRLYDIDVVIGRSLVYGALALFIGAVYVAVVVGIGELVGTGGQPNVDLSILATAVVAVAFQPIRDRLQRIANRLVYGKRATPYEVLAQFSQRVGGAYSSTEILPTMVRMLVDGTGVGQASIWLRVGDQWRRAAVWPDNLPADGNAEYRTVVRHQGEAMGEFRVSKRRGEPLTPVEEKLLNDLAAQAGLALRNVRLTTELETRFQQISQRAAELRASRQRIVAAHDAERSRLERNIHDGAQQHLVALTVKLRLASTLATRNPERARSLLVELQAETRTARETLADLARGIYPERLREVGLVEALKPYATVEAHGTGRYQPDVEMAVYFACLEALQNAAKHARASRVTIHIAEAEGTLTFAVTDDGVGFDTGSAVHGAGLQNMKDRLEAIGGRLEILATPGRGTTVKGRVPVRVLEPVA